MRTSTDGGSNYDATNGNYQCNGANRTGFLVTINVGSDTNEFGISGHFYLYAPHSTSYTFADNSNIVFQYSNGVTGQAPGYTGGGNVRKVAEDVDAVQFITSSGNIESGEIVMYGIANGT